MVNLEKRVQKVFRVISIILFTIIIFYLVLLAGFSTSKIDRTEHTYLVEDSVISNIIAAVIFFTILLLFVRVVVELEKRVALFHDEKEYYKKIANLLLIMIATFAVIFIVSTQRGAWSDQRAIQEIADRWVDGNYINIRKGNYLDWHPHQAGLVLLCVWLSHIFGAYNILAFQLMNVIALIAIYKAMGDIIEDKLGSIEYRIGLYCFGILFIPGILYVGFVYGNLLGLAFSLISFKCVLRFIEKQTYRNGCLVSFSILAAILIKQNYIIFGLAALVYLLFELFYKFRPRILILLLVCSSLIISSSLITKGLVYVATGQELSNGLSKWSWVSMGINENKMRYNGWWDNNNVESYYANDCDSEKQSKISQNEIRERVNYFSQNPEYTLRFFAGKNASQWNNPDFQGTWVNQVMTENTEMRQPLWINSLLQEEGTGFYSEYVNYLQFVILVGVCLHMFFWKDRRYSYELFYYVTFIGGFLFHTIWEAKAQYTISYFWLLLPMSVEGYIDTISRLYKKEITKQKKQDKKKRVTQIVVRLLLVILFVFFCCTNIFYNVVIRNEDTEEYKQYISNKSFEWIKSGKYTIKPKLNPELTLSIEEKTNDEMSVNCALSQSENIINISHSGFNEWQIIGFSHDYVLDVPANTSKEGQLVWAYKQNYTEGQGWHFRKIDENEFMIFHEGYVLTYNESNNRISLQKEMRSDNQIWIIAEQE